MTHTDTLWCDVTKKVLCDRCNLKPRRPDLAKALVMWWENGMWVYRYKRSDFYGGFFSAPFPNSGNVKPEKWHAPTHFGVMGLKKCCAIDVMWWWPCNCVVMWLSRYCLIATTLTPACDTWPNFVALPMNLETKRDTCDTCCRNILFKNIHYSKFYFPLLLVCDMYFVRHREHGASTLCLAQSAWRKVSWTNKVGFFFL